LGFSVRHNDGVCDKDLRKVCGALAIALTDGEFRDISGAELFQELKSFHAVDVIPDMPSRPLDELKCLAKVSLFDVFPNLWIALRILLALSVSLASGERSFFTSEAYQELFTLHDGTAG
jgi:hypothetical protein